MEDLLARIRRLNIKGNSSSNYQKKYSGRSDRRMFGYYKCHDCNRFWQSAYSWAGYSQKCKGCGKQVNPYRQESLVKPEENKIDPNKQHASHLCQKCKEVGDCTRFS